MPPREHGRWQIARRVNCHLVRLFAFNRVCHLDTRALPYLPAARAYGLPGALTATLSDYLRLTECHLDTRALPHTPAARAYGLPAPKGVAFCSGTVQKVAHAAISRLRRGPAGGGVCPAGSAAGAAGGGKPLGRVKVRAIADGPHEVPVAHAVLAVLALICCGVERM